MNFTAKFEKTTAYYNTSFIIPVMETWKSEYDSVHHYLFTIILVALEHFQVHVSRLKSWMLSTH